MAPDASDEPVILRQSPQWVVLAKPAGWHSVSQAPQSPDSSEAAAPTCEAWIRAHMPGCGGLHEAGLVHRLDRTTSGCLLVARDEATQRRLRAAISEEGGGIRKHYLAVLRPGLPPSGDFSLHFTGRHRRSTKVTVHERGDPASRGRCRWRRLGSTTTADLIEVELVGPGRRHQIRAGFAHLGHPLVGDALYRGDPPLPGLHGPALHAWRLMIDGELVEAPPPPAWNQFHEAIRRRDGGSSSSTPTIAG